MFNEEHRGLLGVVRYHLRVVDLYFGEAFVSELSCTDAQYVAPAQSRATGCCLFLHGSVGF